MSIVFQKQDEDAGVRDDDLERTLLMLLFAKWYLTVQRAMHTLVVRVLNLGPIPLDDPAVRQMVLRAQASAVAVNATTQRLIAQRIADGLERGLTARQIAYGTDEFDGIDGLFDRTWKNRPLTVARTEMQRAHLAATVERFQTLGKGVVTHLLISDGDYDAYCAGRNGTAVPVSQAPDLAHPHCRLTVSPVVKP